MRLVLAVFFTNMASLLMRREARCLMKEEIIWPLCQVQTHINNCMCTSHCIFNHSNLEAHYVFKGNLILYWKGNWDKWNEIHAWIVMVHVLLLLLLILLSIQEWTLENMHTVEFGFTACRHKEVIYCSLFFLFQR